MSGEKTEPPTPKRLREARKKGQVAKSNDLTQSFLFLAAAGVLSMGGGAYVSELRQMMADFFQPAVLRGDLPAGELLRRMGSAWQRAFLLLAPLLGALFAVAAAVNFMQVNVLFSADIVKPKLDKLNPVNGFKNIFFTGRTYIELIKNLIKFVIVFWLVYSTVSSSLRDVVLTARMDLLQAAQLAATLLFHLLFKVGAVFLAIGAADYMIQKKLYLKGLRMSRYEVEREFKEDEGDPNVKHQRRHLHQQLLQEGAVEHVPKADAVVVNPTHIAVAIRYDEVTMPAPRVIAKGRELLAREIIQIARKHRVPVLRNVSLAHGLYAIEVGDEIPEQLYEAVAEVLNWVYQLAHAEEAQA